MSHQSDPVMHICHVNLARGFRGGERQTELLIRELSEKGIQQTLLARHAQPLVSRLADTSGLKIIELRKPFWLKAGYVEGDLVHAHENKAAHLASIAHGRGGPPYLITRRVDNKPGTSGSTRRMYERAGHLVAISQAIAGILRDRWPDKPLSVIPSALGKLPHDEQASQALRQKWQGRLVIGHMGALDNSQKGQVYLIRAMHQLVKRCPQVHCVFLGDGPDREWFTKEAQAADYIEFAGHVDNVGDYLAAFDIFAFPSLHEGLGSSLLDAMDFSLPIVASAVDGIPDIVSQDDNGLLVPPSDAQALSDALQKLVSDADLRERLAGAGKRRSLGYRPEVMAQSYIDLYQNMLSVTG